MIAYDCYVGQLLDRQRKGFSATENRITGQQHNRASELCVTLWFYVPCLQRCQAIFAWANLSLSVEGRSLMVAKSIDDRDCRTIVSAGAIAYIYHDALQILEVNGNL